MRFWDGGAAALKAAAVLNIACGSVLAYLVVNILLGVDVQRHARNAVIVCILAMVSDWIGGLYGISAFIGLTCSYFISREGQFSSPAGATECHLARSIGSRTRTIKVKDDRDSASETHSANVLRADARYRDTWNFWIRWL